MNIYDSIKSCVKFVLLFVLIIVGTACSANEEQQLSGSSLEDQADLYEEDPVDAKDSINISTEDNVAESVDIDTFIKLPIREISIDITNDGTDDMVTVYLFGDADDDILKAEELVSNEARSIQVVVQDGVTEEILYDRTFSGAHVGEGQMSLVTDGDEWYLLESACYEQMGYADYAAEVFNWKDGKKIIVDEFNVQFLFSLDAVTREFRNGQEIVSREDVIPDFKEFIENWNEDSRLLAASDIMNSVNNKKSVFVSTDKKEYTMDDFYKTIWERTLSKYTTGYFDELMGYSGYYIYMWSFPNIHGFYFSDEGELLAETWGSGKDGDFIIDLNGDGVSELLSNLMWTGDGVTKTGIYYKKGSQIQFGYADDIFDVEYDNIGVTSEYSYYIPEEKVVEIFYWRSDKDDFESKKYQIDLEKIEFSEFEPSYGYTNGSY
ncbi:MAG: hypothetical protein J1D87_04780 [Lachnospiraceae bacterium]|nr:hypothetical protein [Lachnospiraceae bacterium]